MSQIEDIIAKVVVNHADVFMAGGEWVKFPAAPSTAEWGDYSPREQAAGRLAAQSIRAALDAAGFVIVPKEPTAAMIATAAPLAAHAPGERDFEIALAAVKLLPPNDHPDVADVLAQLVVDFRAMIEARPK